MRAIETLGGEPWCFSPDVIARLTDFQIWDVYVRPAVERSKKWKGGSGAGAEPVAREEVEGPPGEPGSAEHRRACVGAFMSVQGLNRERAEQQYDRQLAQWRNGGK